MQSTIETHKPSATPTPKRLSHVAPSPIVFCPTEKVESDSSFNHYIAKQFQPYSEVLQERVLLPPQTIKNVSELQLEKQDQPTIKQQQKQKSTNKVQVEDENTINDPAIIAALTTMATPETMPNVGRNSYNNEEKGQQQIDDPWWVSHYDEDGFYSIGMIFFLFGFICPPLWWIGTCWPRHPRGKAGKMAERWQKLNMVMSLGFSVILMIAFICIAVLYSRAQ